MSGRVYLAERVAKIAIVDGEFLLESGGTLHSYFDEFRLAANPELLRDVASAMVPLVPARAQVLAGVELGGVPLVVALSQATGLPAAFVRRERKAYGSCRQIEGYAVAGRRTVVVDDVARSGMQMHTTATLLRTAGAIVEDALCVLERPLGGRTLLATANIALRGLLAESDLPIEAVL